MMVVLACHHTINRLTLIKPTHAVLYVQKERSSTNNNTTNSIGDIMAENKTQDYTEDSNEGHVDTREANFQCEKPDKNLGCDPGIDVAG